jgi:hypothetical protein
LKDDDCHTTTPQHDIERQEISSGDKKCVTTQNGGPIKVSEEEMDVIATEQF